MTKLADHLSGQMKPSNNDRAEVPAEVRAEIGPEQSQNETLSAPDPAIAAIVDGVHNGAIDLDQAETLLRRLREG